MSSRLMTDEEARFIMHAVGGDPLIASYIDNQAQHAGHDMRQTMGNMPVCGRCQKIAFHHEQGVICPSCGHRGPAGMKMREHIKRGMYR
jgi:rRNA maturation endonuclease Nob1